jgi:hypothetical protein
MTYTSTLAELYARKLSIEDMLKVVSNPPNHRIYRSELELVNKDIAALEKTIKPLPNWDQGNPGGGV